MSEPRIDPETLAAFLDERLSPVEREAVLRTLEESDADRELLAEVVALREEMHADDVLPLTPLRAARAGRRWLPWALAAAVLLVVVRIGVNRKDALSPIPPDWNGTPWTELRGANDALGTATIAVRVGARLEDLERVTDSSAFDAIRTDLLGLLASQPGAGAAESALRRASPGATTGAVEAVTALLPSADVARGRRIEAMRLRLASDSSTASRREARALLNTFGSTSIDTEIGTLRIALDSALSHAGRLNTKDSIR